MAGLLSRSAWSLALIALWRTKVDGTRPIRVWVPEYFCNAPLAAVRAIGATLIPYPLSQDLVPDLGACRALAQEQRPDLFILVHFFGRPAPAAAARDFCTHLGAWMVEDAAHVLRPGDGIGRNGDFVLYSPHKHLAIPDGAVLVVRRNGPGRLTPEALGGPPVTWPAQLGEISRQAGLRGRWDGARAALWVAKRVLQKIGVGTWRGSDVPFAEGVDGHVADAPALGAPEISAVARRLLARASSELATVARLRQRHQLLWDALLLGDGPAAWREIAVADRPLSREWTPYLAAYRAPSVSAAAAAYQELRRLGLPVTSWPDLMPEVRAQPERHALAWELRHRRLYLPLHQSLRLGAIPKRVARLNAADAVSAALRVEWDVADKVRWRDWLAQAGRSNLLQSWAYGEAKTAHEGWRVHRGVFHRGADAVAIVQVLVKRPAGLVTVSRVNRGPLFLVQCSPAEERTVLGMIGRLGGLWRGRVLTIAPELRLSARSLGSMSEMGFRQYRADAWESVWVDLGLELDTLRKRLDGKWRNMLSFAERAGLELEIGAESALFGWAMDRYREMMRTKGFRGFAPDLLAAVRRHTGPDDPVWVLRAIHEGDPVAGICIACHGAAATYLLGWNGPRGRTLKANQFLLWQAIVHLKRSGLRWLDLGGIDEERTAGISAFKLGLNGERFELAGEYWKW